MKIDDFEKYHKTGGEYIIPVELFNDILYELNDLKSRIKITNDLKDMIISALRYALGRKTYITLETAEFIKNNPDLIDNRIRQVMLRDLKDYLISRKNGVYNDDQCDYDTWLDLKAWLEKGENL